MAGFDFLTQHNGSDEWIANINWDQLDMAVTDQCVLGQLYGSFQRGRVRLSLSMAQTEELGFFLPLNISPERAPNAWTIVALWHEGYDQLTSTWRHIAKEMMGD